MILKALVVGQLQTNCYVIGDEETLECAIIDPGGNATEILRAVAGLCVRYVINTHAHFDHILHNGQVLEALSRAQQTPPQLALHPDEVPLLVEGGGAGWFGLASSLSPQPDRLVQDGDMLSLGQFSLQVLHTPGHSPGSITLHCAAASALFVGDVLFRQGIGRTDLPGGDWDVLMDSICNRLFAFPDDTRVYPGHGPWTTIGQEKRSNPFIDCT
jgi:glyoxylase-like metal-dependent hydrolase (beta-lactamase superfamily II)